ncbi:MAG: NAD(P)/FAD-dependent oxidoreductase [Jatrophihabitans sp.]|uniref:NAD(P)/FAD-dependent oxidoreductase n=1 Tax=Jatrophihabitans sp. TaxID=1932789 RepID=UPI00390E9DB9
MDSYDVIVVGGGMAGASIASELTADRRVLLVDMEPTLAYHTTGRSAAMFLESYGGPVIRALTTSSRAFLLRLEVLRPLPMLHLGLAGRGSAIEDLFAAVHPLVPDVEVLEPAAAVQLQPLLRPAAFELALHEPGAMEIDVHALHQHFVRKVRASGGVIEVSAGVTGATRAAGEWTLTDRTGRQWRAPVVVDAAGAWADEVAGAFGVPVIGLRPLRRTAFMVDAPAGAAAPMIADIDNSFYFKPDAGRLLCSPSDETPQAPGDARADDVQIARAIEVINTVTTLDVRHVRASWAGLRTFTPDRTPAVGYDPAVDGFFWFAGQGGYGIQIAPALARAAADLLRGRPLPDDIRAFGLDVAHLAPERLRNAHRPAAS